MIAPWPGLIDWMISSLSRLAALPAAHPPSSSSSLPVTLTLPLPLQLSAPLTLSPPMHQFLCVNHFTSLTFPLSGSYCSSLMCLQQWLPSNLQDSNFHKRSWFHNHCEEHHQERFCLFTRWFQDVFTHIKLGLYNQYRIFINNCLVVVALNASVSNINVQANNNPCQNKDQTAIHSFTLKFYPEIMCLFFHFLLFPLILLAYQLCVSVVVSSTEVDGDNLTTQHNNLIFSLYFIFFF